MSRTLIAIVGVNGAGKTTLSAKLADALHLNHVNGDAFLGHLKKHVYHYEDLDISYPNDKFLTVKQFKIDFRNELTRILLDQNLPVIFDATGQRRIYRDQFLSPYRSGTPTKIIMIWATIDREEQMERLKIRDAKGARWRKQLEEKDPFEPPEPNEADVILEYTQNNYQEIEDKLRDLL